MWRDEPSGIWVYHGVHPMRANTPVNEKWWFTDIGGATPIFWVGQICCPCYTFYKKYDAIDYVIFDTRQSESRKSQTVSSDDYVRLMVMTTKLMMPAKIRSAGNLSHKPPKPVIAIRIFVVWLNLQSVNTGQLLAGPNALWPTRPKFWWVMGWATLQLPPMFIEPDRACLNTIVYVGQIF